MTADVALCPLTDLPRYSCDHCRNGNGRQAGARGPLRTYEGWDAMAAVVAEAAGRELGPWISAQYHGRCPHCGFRWEPGDLIRKDPDEGAWICSECGSR